MLEWLKQDLPEWEEYHNHKEKMAWTVVAFYCPAIIVLSYKAGIVLNPWIKVILIPGIVILFLSVFVFVNMQFEMRWIANDIVIAIRRPIIELLGQQQTQNQLDTSLLDMDAEISNAQPKFLRDIIDQCKPKRTRQLFLTGLGNLICLRWRSVDARLRTELSSYMVLFIVTLAAIMCLWLPPQKQVSPSVQTSSASQTRHIQSFSTNRPPQNIIVEDANKSIHRTR